MRLKYVASKSKFIDLDARHPRLMRLETVVDRLQACGITDVSATISKIMADPIELPDLAKKPQPHDIVEQFQILYRDRHFYVLGLKLDLYQASQYLIDKHVPLSDALRALAIAVDTSKQTR